MNTVQNPAEETVAGMNDSKPILRNNFLLMALSGLLIIVGFILMTGSSTDTAQYNPDIFSTRRIVVGPMLCFIGYVLMAISIIVKPKNK